MQGSFHRIKFAPVLIRIRMGKSSPIHHVLQYVYNWILGAQIYIILDYSLYVLVKRQFLQVCVTSIVDLYDPI